MGKNRTGLHRDHPEDAGAVGPHVELERLIDFLDKGRLTEAERKEVVEHLFRCSQCVALLVALVPDKLALVFGERGLTDPESLASHPDHLGEEVEAAGQHVELERLTAYYEGRMTTAEREELQEHLSLCVRCSVLLRELHEFASDSGERGLSGPEHLEQEAWEWLVQHRPSVREEPSSRPVEVEPAAANDEKAGPKEPYSKGRILVTKAFTLAQSGEPELALKTLSEAEPFVSGLNEPRLLFILRYNFAATLCDLGQFMEAQLRMSEITALAAETGNELDPVRALWLRGRIDSGLGRAQEAEAAFKQVWQAFRQRGMANDFAKITLDLVSLLCKQGCWSEVRSLATETMWTFKAQGIHSEAEKALAFFCEMAAAERLTVEMAQRILEYLSRAEKNLGLRFNE